MLGGAPAAAAERRVALVVGVSAYRHFAKLPNPRNDANAVAAKLSRLGLAVRQVLDPDLAALRRAVAAFGDDAQGSAVALFYYSGHGIQVDQRNYLIPVDANLERSGQAAGAALALDQLMEGLDRRGGGANLVFLDACRNNPLPRSLSRGSVAEAPGLAPAGAPAGTLIAFATAPGRTASDGSGDNSPFTTAFLRYVDEPGLEVRQLMTRVRQSVLDATGGDQVPWDQSSLTADLHLAATRPRAPAPSASDRPAAPSGGGAEGGVLTVGRLTGPDGREDARLTDAVGALVPRLRTILLAGGMPASAGPLVISGRVERSAPRSRDRSREIGIVSSYLGRSGLEVEVPAARVARLSVKLTAKSADGRVRVAKGTEREWEWRPDDDPDDLDEDMLKEAVREAMRGLADELARRTARARR